MPKDLFRRAPLRLFTSASILALSLCAAAAFAQGTAQPTVNDRQVQTFFNGIALDQQLAEQYSSSAPRSDSDCRCLAVARDADRVAADRCDDTAAIGARRRAMIADSASRSSTPASPVQTVMLVLASLALLAFAFTVLTLAIRELRKDAQQRKRTHRRRVKRRDTSTPAHAS